MTVDYDMTVQVDVSVEEALTGRVQNTSFQVNLHKYKYKMDVIKTSDYFKPGLMYTVFVSKKYDLKKIYFCMRTDFFSSGNYLFSRDIAYIHGSKF